MTNVVLFSGGIDSCAILYSIRKCKDPIVALNFDYGQKNRKNELIAMDKIMATVAEHNVTYLSIELPKVLFVSALTSPEISVLERDTNVPFRNGVFISLAVAYAESTGGGVVYVGTHQRGPELEDSPHHDGTPLFTAYFENSVSIGTGGKVQLVTPFAEWTKDHIFKFASALGVPFEVTWSCYDNKKFHCGKCRACRERKKGFADLGILDPTEYLID